MAQIVEFPRSLSSLGDLFDFMGKEFERNKVDEGSAFWVSLAVEEVFTNMIRHNESSGSRISVALGISEHRISARLTDFGVPPFDPSSVPRVDPTLPADARTPGGLGVFFVHSKMDDVSYRHEDGNLSVALIKKRALPVAG